MNFLSCSAAFTLKALPFKIPYPVPFKLLGDERKGWIDVTYLSPDGRLRLSRGNKARGGVSGGEGEPGEKGRAPGWEPGPCAWPRRERPQGAPGVR